jgi:hypothetical protein
LTDILQASVNVGTSLPDAVLFELASCARQAHFVPAAELVPYMAWLCEVLIELVNAPYIVLMVLLILGVNCVQFTDGTGRCKQGRVEKTREAFKSAGQGRGCDVEVIIGICRCCECIRGAVVSGKKL